VVLVLVALAGLASGAAREPLPPNAKSN
jgi:hypothetical protein